MLSTSFIVSASPVLSSPEPLYGNTQHLQRHQYSTQVDPYEAADQIYGLSSDSRRVKRSFSVGRTSDLDLARKTNNKRSVSQSRDPRAALSPVQRRPLPSVPSVPSLPSPQPSPSLYQRSLLSDIYRYWASPHLTREKIVVNISYLVLPKTENTTRVSTINFTPRQRVGTAAP